MTNCKDIHSRYVLRAMEDHCLNGDAYVAEDILYHRCKERQRGLSYATFKADLAEQIRLGYIHPEEADRMEYDNCRAAMGMLTEIFDTETVKWERRKPFPLAFCIPILICRSNTARY